MEDLQKQQTCGDCRFWHGICGKGKVNCIARSPACESFEPKIK